MCVSTILHKKPFDPLHSKKLFGSEWLLLFIDASPIDLEHIRIGHSIDTLPAFATRHAKGD